MDPGGHGWPLMTVSSVREASGRQSVSGKAVGDSTAAVSGTGRRVTADRLVPLLAVRAVSTRWVPLSPTWDESGFRPGSGSLWLGSCSVSSRVADRNWTGSAPGTSGRDLAGSGSVVASRDLTGLAPGASGRDLTGSDWAETGRGLVGFVLGSAGLCWPSAVLGASGRDLTGLVPDLADRDSTGSVLGVDVPRWPSAAPGHQAAT